MKARLLFWEDLTEEEMLSVPDNGCGKEYANYLEVDFGNGDTELYSDAMESEDATFTRDLDWIIGLVERAFEAGKNSK